MAQLYQHQPLDLSRQQIRLLRFQTHGESSPNNIGCKLQTFNLESAPPYVALSYTWGDSTPVYRIHINEDYLEIGGNLYSFCKAFCRSKKAASKCRTSYLWIDQVCIHQGNPTERNHQVNMMCEIYSTATSTLIWLNDDTHIHDELRPWLANNITRHLSNKHLREKLPLYRLYARKDTADCLYELFGHRYWRRLWIIREIWLAKKTRIFTEGDILLDWDNVVRLTMIAKDSSWNWIWGSTSAAAGLVWRERVNRILVNMNIEDLSLMTLCGIFRWAECIEPRDVVYGFMGIANPRFRVLVDYSKSIQEVLLDVLTSSIQTFSCFNKDTLSGLGIRLELSRSQHAAWNKMISAIDLEFDVENQILDNVELPTTLGFGQRGQSCTRDHWVYSRSRLPKGSQDDGWWWYEWDNEVHAFPCVIEAQWDPAQIGPSANEFGDWGLLPEFAHGEEPPPSGTKRRLRRKYWWN